MTANSILKKFEFSLFFHLTGFCVKLFHCEKNIGSLSNGVQNKKQKHSKQKKNPEAGKSGALGKKLELKSQQGGRVLPPALLPSGGLFTPECTSTPLGPSFPPHSVQNDPFPLPLQGKGLAPPPGESLPKCPLAQDFPRDNLSRDCASPPPC